MTVILVAGGSGGLGRFVVDELVAAGTFSAVKVLARPGSKDKLKGIQGAEVVTADYGNHQELVSALKGVDIVVSTLSEAALPQPQLALIKAAKEANVKRFVPSEFGVDSTKEIPFDFYAPAIESQNALKSAELEYIIYAVGLFPDADFQPWFGFDIANNKIEIVGDGNTDVSWTWRQNVAKFVADTVAAPENKNVVLSVEGDVKTFNQVAQAIEKKKGTKLDVTHVPIAEALENARLSGDHGVIALTEIRAATAQGLVKVSNPKVSRLTTAFKTVDDWVQQNV